MELVPKTESIAWADIPGYGIMLKTFLIELKKREILQYPDALVNASKAIFINPRLMSTGVEILLHKTKYPPYTC